VDLGGGGEPVRSQTLTVAGLKHAVSVSFTAQGVPDIRVATDHDMFLALASTRRRPASR
jgi:acyl-homoserine lactone acylase PvdQ